MKKKILVVDDNQQMLEFMADLLEEEGHDVSTAQDGFSALNRIADFTPDVMFVDLVMPNIGGDKLCKIVRNMKHLEDCYLVLLTAAAAELEFDEAEIVADACIAKGPFGSIVDHVLTAVDESDSHRKGRGLKKIVGLGEVYPRRMTTELLSRNRHLETILESMAEGILEIFDGKIVYANSAAVSLFGVNPEMLLAKSPADVFSADVRPQVEKLLKKPSGTPSDMDPDTPVILNDRQVTLKHRTVRGDIATGIIMITDVTARKQAEKELAEYRDHLEALVKERTAELTQTNEMLQQEISERLLAEEALVESKALFDSFMKNLPALAFMKDRDGRYIYLNEAYRYILRLDPDDLIGKTDDDIWPVEVASPLKENDRTVMSEGRVLNTVETVVTDGAKQYYLVTKFPIFKDGEPFLLSGVAIDITQRHRTEREKKKLEIKLLQAQKMEALGVLAGSVAHDLNNILSGIVSYPDLLLMDLPEESPLRKPILTVKNAGERAAAIVNDLMALARRGAAVMDVIGLNDIVSAYLKSPEYRKLKLDHPNAEVITDLEAGLLNITGSRAHLFTTLMNLISNAFESMPEGGEIRISTENRYLDGPLNGYEETKEGDYVVLSVADTGTGISAEDVKRIFEPFYTKKVMGRSGTGLGMAVVWGTVKDHLGYLDVQSSMDRGTTFSLFFPATRQEVPEADTMTSLDEYAGNGETILVVDDRAEQREIACEILKRLNYRVTSVSSGEAAIEYLKTHTVDLAILDMIMEPGIDGLETYRRILDIHPGQRAMIASGFSESEQVKAVQKLGIGAYVKKPYLLETLAKAVHGELN